MNTPILETDRIILRPLNLQDAEAVYNNWASDPEVAKFLRWSAHDSIDVTIWWLGEEEKDFSCEKSFNWGFVLKETGELIGSGGLHFSEEKNMFELGYCLAKKYWGLGLATEASRAFLDFAKNTLKQTHLFSGHAKDNVASGAVIKKLGFVLTGSGEYTCFDGVRKFESYEYELVLL
jgi:ribosomal-protein-alanine N-acetyltransferase